MNQKFEEHINLIRKIEEENIRIYQQDPKLSSLLDKIGELDEEYFGDFLFEDEALVDKYLSYIPDDKTEKDKESSRDFLPISIRDFSYMYYHYEIKNFNNGIMGAYTKATRTLSVSPDHLNDDIVLLHEMIHLHEDVLDDIPNLYRDILFYELYNTLKAKVKNIDDIIVAWGGCVNQLSMTNFGGYHSILFLLKSLELDIRKGYELGTIMQYETTKFISSLPSSKNV